MTPRVRNNLHNREQQLILIYCNGPYKIDLQGDGAPPFPTAGFFKNRMMTPDIQLN
jgi:hypothetical protein